MSGYSLTLSPNLAANDDAPPVPGPVAPARRRLLIVDDEDCVRVLVRRVAESEGFAVTMAANGSEATKEIKRETYDVVITDLYMPECDGLELIQRLRTLRPTPKIIAISGGGTYGFRPFEAASHMGARHVLEKPFAIGQLVDLLRSVRGETQAAGR